MCELRSLLFLEMARTRAARCALAARPDEPNATSVWAKLTLIKIIGCRQTLCVVAQLVVGVGIGIVGIVVVGVGIGIVGIVVGIVGIVVLVELVGPRFAIRLAAIVGANRARAARARLAAFFAATIGADEPDAAAIDAKNSVIVEKLGHRRRDYSKFDANPAGCGRIRAT